VEACPDVLEHMNAIEMHRFGFIVHCRSTRELRLVLARYRASAMSLLPEQALKSYCLKHGFIEDIFTFDRVVTDRQAVCQGKAFCLLLTPDQLLEHQGLATELVIRASHMAESWGARMIGLGALCAVVGARGVEVANSCTAAVTTGNSLTVYATIVCFEKIMQRLEVDPARHTIAIIGFPGSIALAITKILRARGFNLLLVSRQQTPFVRKFLENTSEGSGSIVLIQDIPAALKASRIIFTATSTGQIIDQDMLLPGAVVFDIAQPKDVIYRRNGRRDVLIVDAGLISLPRATTRRYRYSGLRTNDIPSCLGETMALTLEARWEQFSLGRELRLDSVAEIGRLSEAHGFIFDNFRSFGRPIPIDNMRAARAILQQR
jgi:putrescine aminotransferase